jgi:hypothetical protein
VVGVEDGAAAVLDKNGILPNSPTGLLQRIAIIAGWGWVALVALRLLLQRRFGCLRAGGSRRRWLNSLAPLIRQHHILLLKEAFASL